MYKTDMFLIINIQPKKPQNTHYKWCLLEKPYNLG